MSQRRRIQRASKGTSKGKELMGAMGELSRQMSALEGMEQIPSLVKVLGEATTRASSLADAMVADYQTLLGRIVAIEKHLGIVPPVDDDTDIPSPDGEASPSES